LDVAIADKHEVYSWVGAARFEEGDLSQLVGGGQTITGQFAALLLSIFNDHPTMSFEGTRRIGERRLLEYSYRTPTNRSEYRVRVGSEEVTTAYQGAVLLDSKTGDVVRVTARSAPLPEETGYCQDGSELDYSRLPTAASDVLIPRKTNSWAIGRDGESFVSESAYSSCREYVGESVLRLDDPESADPRASGKVAVGNAASLPAAIPPGLPFDCSIFTPIDSETTAAGDPLQAVLRSSLIDSSGKVLAPAGARVNARVMTFVQRPAVGDRKASLEIGVQLRSVEVDGNRVPLSAFLTSERLPENAWFRLNPRPNQATFLFYQKRLHLTKLDSRWVTATPAAAGTPTH
jgi:hypothetical protein